MTLMHSVCLLAVVGSACAGARSPTVGSSESSDLLVQAYTFDLDSLASGENAHARPCLSIDKGRAGSDPPAAVLGALRKRHSAVLVHSQCSKMFQDLAAVHDTILIAVSLDSVAMNRVSLRTWRSGLWGAGYSCAVRKRENAWILEQCRMEWIS